MTALPQNRFKRGLAEGRQQIGLWSTLSTAFAAEAVAGAGFDWLLLDTEHSPGDVLTVLAQRRALSGYAEVSPVVRPASNDPVLIKRALDVGARSLIVPFVQNAEEASAAVAAARYPPLGSRGVSVGPRANDYGRVKNYHRNAHLDTCIIVQLESRTALVEIEAIAAIDGVDGLFIGPSDLAADFGHLGNPLHAEVQEAITDAATRIRATGKSAGTLAGDVEDVDRLFGLGFNYTAAGSDVGILARNAERIAARFRTS